MSQVNFDKALLISFYRTAVVCETRCWSFFVGAKPAHWRRLRDLFIYLFIYLCVGLLVSRGLLRKSLRPETGKKLRESLGMRSAVRVE